MLFLGKCVFFSSSDLVSRWRWAFSRGLRSMNFRVLGEGWCWDVVSGQAAQFALGHVILAAGLSPSAGLPGVPGGLLPLGCFRKLSSSRPAGRVCQRLETEASQSPQGSERKGGTRLQSRLLAKDCVLRDTRPRGAGAAGSRAWLPGWTAAESRTASH